MKWSSNCWFLPIASERIFHKSQTVIITLVSPLPYNRVLVFDQENIFTGALQIHKL